MYFERQLEIAELERQRRHAMPAYPQRLGCSAKKFLEAKQQRFSKLQRMRRVDQVSFVGWNRYLCPVGGNKVLPSHCSTPFSRATDSMQLAPLKHLKASKCFLCAGQQSKRQTEPTTKPWQGLESLPVSFLIHLETPPQYCGMNTGLEIPF